MTMLSLSDQVVHAHNDIDRPLRMRAVPLVSASMLIIAKRLTSFLIVSTFEWPLTRLHLNRADESHRRLNGHSKTDPRTQKIMPRHGVSDLSVLLDWQVQ